MGPEHDETKFQGKLIPRWEKQLWINRLPRKDFQGTGTVRGVETSTTGTHLTSGIPYRDHHQSTVHTILIGGCQNQENSCHKQRNSCPKAELGLSMVEQISNIRIL